MIFFFVKEIQQVCCLQNLNYNFFVKIIRTQSVVNVLAARYSNDCTDI